MRPARLGAVSYLNTKPLVRGLGERADLFTLRFDVPSVCATLLHEGRVDVGLVPAIEYLRGDYTVVPGISIASDGAVASVALFSTRPIEQVKTLALDISSRTSVALTRILCARKWGIAPAFTPAEPDIRAMLQRAALGEANLAGASFKRAYIYWARLEGVDLSKALDLTQAQIDMACGNAQTKLPAGLTMPSQWPCAED